jgi:hypothetical protein
VNIGHIAWGRDKEQGEAFTLINLDARMSDALVETIRKHPKVFWAQQVTLPDLPG